MKYSYLFDLSDYTNLKAELHLTSGLKILLKRKREFLINLSQLVSILVIFILLGNANKSRLIFLLYGCPNKGA